MLAHGTALAQQRLVEPGDLVADRFRLEKELGRGGMGSVWRAHHISLDAPCAIKFIEGEPSAMVELRARFSREAKAAAKLRSPHVVTVLDHGEWNGTPFLVMELLDGEDLSHRIRRLGRLRSSQVVSILRDVGRALDRAHAAGIVHRDLKPENIFLVRDGNREIAKVLDFGIAKVSGSSLGDSKTRTGALLGTPYYMSPEQADGTLAVDHRSDLWALGVVAFECVTGRLPFDSEAIGDLLMKIMVKPIVKASDVAAVPAEFDRFWERASERDPSKRFQSAEQLTTALSLSLGIRVSDERFDTSDEAKLEESGSEPAVVSIRITPPGGGLDADDPEVASMRTMVAPEGASTLNGQTRGQLRSESKRIAKTLVGVGAAIVVATLLLLFVIGRRAPASGSALDASATVSLSTNTARGEPTRSTDTTALPEPGRPTISRSPALATPPDSAPPVVAPASIPAASTIAPAPSAASLPTPKHPVSSSAPPTASASRRDFGF